MGLESSHSDDTQNTLRTGLKKGWIYSKIYECYL
uniref:Uncharacterized protein n=1 Tax=Anguilla anguilla TaxID=7936 RepID=A0A0E9RZQ9_ANGAN